MGAREESPFAASAEEPEIQETRLAIQRVLERAPISEMARRALEGALEALGRETD